jgi:two-component system response regulator YesN
MNEIYGNLIEMDKHNVTCHNWVFLYEENQVPTLTDLTVQHTHMSVWSELLKHGNKEQVVNEALKVIESWRGMEGLDYKVLQVFYQDFLQMVHHVLKQKEVLGYKILSDQISPERSIVATRSVVDLQDWVKEIVDKVFEYVQSLDKNLKVVDKIKHYVLQNIDRDFSRQNLADYVQLSPDHVVKLFKKETGTLISDYILKERMNKASSLLVRSNIPISEISLLVGYSNFSYFSKVFKSVTRLNPQEYRKQHQII